MQKIVLFDRDGTLIKDPEDLRVDSIDKIELFDDTISALKTLHDNGFSIIIITNQAGIAEGRLTEEEFTKINNVVLQRLAASGITILDTYMNGEADVESASEWRKPGPAMLRQAAMDYNFPIDQVYMVGDNVSDIQAAINAECKGGILVKTANYPVSTDLAIYSAANLTDVIDYIINEAN